MMDGNTALHHAAKKYSFLVEILVQQGFGLDKKNEEGKTALHCAAESKNFLSLKYLIGFGANVLSKDSHGKIRKDFSGDHQLISDHLEHVEYELRFQS